MQLDQTQIGVARGMALALGLALALLWLSVAVQWPQLSNAEELSSRTKLAAWSMLSPASVLFVCIARLAKHRFFTPEDINGSALTNGTDRARLLQSLLQNTLEQAALALATYVAVCALGPPRFLSAVPTAAAMFLVGRVFFFAGYSKGAPTRAFGFALTFYPTVILLLGMIALAVHRAGA